jgi:predicted O-linked N-acetylglucosamine transferase (SPINDLY family)
VKPAPDELYRAAIRLHQQGRTDDAARLYDDVLRQVPAHYGALHLKGVLALQSGNPGAAIELFERSLRLEPRQALALSNLGVALRGKDRMLDAIAALEKSVVLDPRSADAWTNLAQTQLRAGFTREAIASGRRAIALAPERLGARSFVLFGANNLAEIDPMLLATEAREYGAIAERLAPPRTTHANDPDPDRPLRVGLVSGDLRAHPVGRFLDAVIAAINPAKLSFYAYSDTTEPDDLTARLKSHTPVWRNTKRLNDKALGEQLVADAIDIAVDLGGHSASQRLLTFAGRPAPVSFSWIGYFATTGLGAIDYVLANRWAVPPGEESQWSEAIWRLPDTYLCFTAPQNPPAPTPLPALTAGHITFGSFNNFNKLSDATLRAWAALLAATPGARLVLRSSGSYHDGVIDTLEARLAAAGIDLARIRIDGRIASYLDHLKSYGEIDIALDPFPYNGGTTTVEALYMGVPVLVRAGDRYVAHMGESILHNAGLADWIAPDEAAYAALGARLAADLPALAALRASLRPLMLASPLFDAPRFARNFEAALRAMWQTWCAAQRRA